MRSESEWIRQLLDLIEKLMELLKGTISEDQAQALYDHYLKP